MAIENTGNHMAGNESLDESRLQPLGVMRDESETQSLVRADTKAVSIPLREHSMLAQDIEGGGFFAGLKMASVGFLAAAQKATASVALGALLLGISLAISKRFDLAGGQFICFSAFCLGAILGREIDERLRRRRILHDIELQNKSEKLHKQRETIQARKLKARMQGQKLTNERMQIRAEVEEEVENTINKNFKNKLSALEIQVQTAEKEKSFLKAENEKLRQEINNKKLLDTQLDTVASLLKDPDSCDYLLKNVEELNGKREARAKRRVQQLKSELFDQKQGQQASEINDTES